MLYPLSYEGWGDERSPRAPETRDRDGRHDLLLAPRSGGRGALPQHRPHGEGARQMGRPTQDVDVFTIQDRRAHRKAKPWVVRWRVDGQQRGTCKRVIVGSAGSGRARRGSGTPRGGIGRGPGLACRRMSCLAAGGGRVGCWCGTGLERRSEHGQGPYALARERARPVMPRASASVATRAERCSASARSDREPRARRMRTR